MGDHFGGFRSDSAYSVREIQVLCPMNRGGVGARSLNIDLQAASNPSGENKVEHFGWTFAPGDKVMQMENDYDKEVYNGDIGYIIEINSDEGELTVRFDDRPVTYGFGELDALVPAYAVTIHKSQGSESGRGDPGPNTALSAATAKPPLHRRHARRSKKGRPHRCPERHRSTQVVKVARVAAPIGNNAAHADLTYVREGPWAARGFVLVLQASCSRY